MKIDQRTLILLLLASYNGICGLSAILLPKIWLISAGLDPAMTLELRLVFGVLGAYLLALSVTTILAIFHIEARHGIVWTLIIANAFDLIMTSSFVLQGQLSIANGLAFIMVCIVWIVLLKKYCL